MHVTVLVPAQLEHRLRKVRHQDDALPLHVESQVVLRGHLAWGRQVRLHHGGAAALIDELGLPFQVPLIEDVLADGRDFKLNVCSDHVVVVHLYFAAPLVAELDESPAAAPQVLQPDERGGADEAEELRQNIGRQFAGEFGTQEEVKLARDSRALAEDGLGNELAMEVRSLFIILW